MLSREAREGRCYDEDRVTKVDGEEVSSTELLSAKKYLLGTRAIDLQENVAFTSSMLFDEIYGLGYNNWKNYSTNIESVSCEGVQS